MHGERDAEDWNKYGLEQHYVAYLEATHGCGEMLTSSQTHHLDASAIFLAIIIWLGWEGQNENAWTEWVFTIDISGVNTACSKL